MMALWTRARRCWRAGLLIVAGILMLASCGQVSSPHAGAPASVTATPTATPAPITLSWQPASVSQGAFRYVVAPSDGRVTYACGYTSRQTVAAATVWSTRDRGQTWSRPVTLPVSSALTFSDCQLVVDAQNAQRVMAVLNTAKIGASPPPAYYLAFLSQDGGATWRALPKIGPHVVFSLASYGGALYVAGDGVSASSAEPDDVWVSRDGGASWRSLGASSLSPNPHIWINPQTGDMLGTNDFDLIPTLWRSANGGASWTKINVPNVAGAGGSQTLLVAPNGAGWRICAAGTPAPGRNATNALACSLDLGAAWTTLPGLNPTQHSPKGFTFTAPVGVFAIADDGSLLASYDDSAADVQFDMLAAGASAWVPLSPPPGASLTGPEPEYTTGPGGGMLWAAEDDPAHPFATALYP